MDSLNSIRTSALFFICFLFPLLNILFRKQKRKAMSHIRSLRKLSDMIDDKQIAGNKEVAFKVTFDTSNIHPSYISLFRPPPPSIPLSLIMLLFRSENSIKLKWKSICSASEMSSDLFLWNVNISYDIQSSLMNHYYCCSRSQLDMQLWTAFIIM